MNEMKERQWAKGSSTDWTTPLYLIPYLPIPYAYLTIIFSIWNKHYFTLSSFINIYLSLFSFDYHNFLYKEVKEFSLSYIFYLITFTRITTFTRG